MVEQVQLIRMVVVLVEWCWLVWPRFNTTSSALNNNDFTDAKTAGLDPNSVKPYFEPGIAPSITNTGIGDFVDFEERRWDHIHGCS